MKEYVTILKCLGDQTRLRILKIIMVSQTELCVCEIVDSLGLPFYTISKHLKELKHAELVNEKREGTFIMYSLSEQKSKFMKKTIDLMNEIPEVMFENDIKLLHKRLQMREKGKCIVGMNNKR